MKKLKTLDEHNLQVKIVGQNLPQPNGIECPNCGSELFDSNPNMTLMSFPPQKRVICLKDSCDYSGFRFI